jgi:ribosomal protein S9
MASDGAQRLISIWEERFMVMLAGESPTLRSVADSLASMKPSDFDLIAASYVAGVGPLGQTVAFASGLARALDRLDPTARIQTD